MKNFKSVIFTVLTVCFLLSSASTSQAADTLQIITTIFPEYDWVRNVLGDNPAEIEVMQLLDNGVDLHSYQPTADDILKLSGCGIAQTIVQNTDSKDQQILTMDSMQSTTSKDSANGTTYLSIMEKNLEVLKEALQ